MTISDSRSVISVTHNICCNTTAEEALSALTRERIVVRKKSSTRYVINTSAIDTVLNSSSSLRSHTDNTTTISGQILIGATMSSKFDKIRFILDILDSCRCRQSTDNTTCRQVNIFNECSITEVHSGFVYNIVIRSSINGTSIRIVE